MKKILFLLILGIVLMSCSDNTNNVTGKDRTKGTSFKDVKQDREVTSTEKEVKKQEVVEPVKEPIKEPVKEPETTSVTLDGNESFWWVLAEFGDMKGNTLIMQDHPYLDFDELKSELKKSFNRPKDNPFLLNFVQISKETYIHNATK